MLTGSRVALWCGVAVFVVSSAMGQQPDKGSRDVRRACTITPRRDAKDAADVRTLGDLLRAGCEPSEAVETLSHLGVGVTPPFLPPGLTRPASEKKASQQENKGTHADR